MYRRTNKIFIKVVSILLSVVLIATFSLGFFLVLPTEVSVEAASSNSTDTRSRLGINLEGLSDWSGAKMFTDLMKTSRVWGTANSPWVELSSSQMDQYGWPTVNDCGAVVVADTAVDPGTYKLSFESNSKSVQISPIACSFTVKNVAYGSNNKVTADLEVPSGQNNFMISFKNTNGGVRNMTLMRPGYEDGTKLFTDEFLKFIEPFSTLRFMDYLSTNGQNTNGDLTQLQWSDRKTANHASQAATFGKAKGGCWEYLVELVNQTGKDAWINIPYNASDDYVNSLATFLKNNVNDGINIYVELSNEVWNWSFPQANVNDALAKKDSIANNYYLQYAKQTVNIAKIFRKVYGQGAMNENIRVILAWQIGWYPSDWQPREMFTYINNYHEAPKNLIYALAGAPYFSEPKPEDATSVTAVHNYMIQSSDDFVDDRKTYIKAALDWGLKGGAVCYEGGPHHQGQVDINLSTRMAAHRDAKMQEILVRDLQTNWFDIGGGLFCYFSATGAYNKYGCWALSEVVTDLNTPKYKAIMQLYNENKQYAAVNPSYSPHTAAPSTPTPSATVRPSPTTSQNVDKKELVYSADFNNGTAGSGWNGYSVVDDPTDTTNKVISYTETNWQAKLSEALLTACDPNQVYTIMFKLYGDAAHVAISYGEPWELVETRAETEGANGIVTMDRKYYQGLYVRPVANEWNTYVATFKGYSQYKLYLMTQCDNNVNGGTALFDDVKIYKGDYFAELMGEIEASKATPTPTATSSNNTGANPTITPGTTASATATNLPNTTAEATVMPTITPDVKVVKKVKFTKKKIKVKVGKKATLKVKLTPAKGLSKKAKKVKWSIDKKGKKVVKFVKAVKKLSGKLTVKIKAKKKGKAKITCKAPSGKKAVCRITVK